MVVDFAFEVPRWQDALHRGAAFCTILPVYTPSIGVCVTGLQPAHQHYRFARAIAATIRTDLSEHGKSICYCQSTPPPCIAQAAGRAKIRELNPLCQKQSIYESPPSRLGTYL